MRAILYSVLLMSITYGCNAMQDTRVWTVNQVRHFLQGETIRFNTHCDCKNLMKHDYRQFIADVDAARRLLIRRKDALREGYGKKVVQNYEKELTKALAAFQQRQQWVDEGKTRIPE